MMNNEKGQALPIALLVLAVGSLIIAPTLGQASSTLTGSRVYGQKITERYSADAGVEHAIWNLTNGDLASQLPDQSDSITYQMSETVNGVAPSITVTVDQIDGEGGSTGEITDAVIDTLEFDTVKGKTPGIINISGDVYAIAYAGDGDDGFLKTVEIATDGTIADSVIDTLEFDNDKGKTPGIIHISGNIYAIAYTGDGDDGFLKTVEIATDGQITNTVIDTLEFDTDKGKTPRIVHISGNIYAIAYTGDGDDGFLKTVEIATDGQITNTAIDTLGFDTDKGKTPDIVHVAGNVYAIAYAGDGDDGLLKTVEIATDGQITNTVIDALEFDTDKGKTPGIIHISGNVYAIAYTGDGDDGLLKTVEIVSTEGAFSVYTLESVAGDSTITSIVRIVGEIATILSWQVE